MAELVTEDSADDCFLKSDNNNDSDNIIIQNNKGLTLTFFKTATNSSPKISVYAIPEVTKRPRGIMKSRRQAELV